MFLELEKGVRVFFELEVGEVEFDVSSLPLKGKDSPVPSRNTCCQQFFLGEYWGGAEVVLR